VFSLNRTFNLQLPEVVLMSLASQNVCTGVLMPLHFGGLVSGHISFISKHGQLALVCVIQPEHDLGPDTNRGFSGSGPPLGVRQILLSAVPTHQGALNCFLQLSGHCQSPPPGFPPGLKQAFPCPLLPDWSFHSVYGACEAHEFGPVYTVSSKHSSWPEYSEYSIHLAAICHMPSLVLCSLWLASVS